LDGGQKDHIRARLDQGIDMALCLAKLAATIDRSLLEQSFCAFYADVPRNPPLPKQSMAGLTIPMLTHDLSDETLCDS
jgi:hypothetical protein